MAVKGIVFDVSTGAGKRLRFQILFSRVSLALSRRTIWQQDEDTENALDS